MGRLTTHVLDTAKGHPARGILIQLYRLDGKRNLISEIRTNSDGRCEAPLLQGDDFLAGIYELVFQAGEYFQSEEKQQAGIRFLDEIVIRFGVTDGSGNYHVPLILSPFGYSTYRGS